MILTASPEPLELKLGVSPWRLWSTALLALAAGLVLQITHVGGDGELVAAMLVVTLQLALALYLVLVSARLTRPPYGKGLVLRLAADGWYACWGGATHPVDLHCRFLSAYLVVVQLQGHRGRWLIAISADQVEADDFRAFRRVLLHGRWPRRQDD